MAARTLDAADELWIRLVWFTRLRWMIAPSLVALASLVEWASGTRLFPMLPVLVLLAGLLAANALYAALLERWRVRADAHRRKLEVLAHVQVVVDIAVDATAMYLSGGTASPFWPFFALTVLAAALFFPRRFVIASYALAASVLFVAVGFIEGGVGEPSVFLLPMLLTAVALIAIFYSTRIALAHEATLELARLRAEKAAAEEVARKKDEILSVVSHELRSPLAALRGFVDLAQMMRPRGGVASQPLSRTLEKIDAQVDRMTRLVDDLYDVTSVRAGHLKVEPRTCDLISIVTELVDRFRTLYPDLAIGLEGPKAMWGSFDPARIDQMVTNLVGNAVKYAAASPVILRVSPSSGPSAHIEVIDRGPGIPADKLPMIFEAFTRIDEQGHKSGLGLGLSIAREIAVLHGGAIWVESQVGLGTTFHVRLPTKGIQPPS